MKPAAIARRTGVSYGAVYALTRLEERGFRSEGEYRDYLARQAGFSTHQESRNHRAQQRGFGSLHAWQDSQIKGRGFASFYEYQKYLVTSRGFESYKEYRDHFAKQKGFASHQEYAAALEEKRSRRVAYRTLGDLVRSQLDALGKPQTWLARQLGVTQHTVSCYARGKSIPRGKRLERLLDILGADQQTKSFILDDLT